MSKKLIALLLALLTMAFAIVACEPKENEGEDTTAEETVAEGEETSADTEAETETSA